MGLLLVNIAAVECVCWVRLKGVYMIAICLAALLIMFPVGVFAQSTVLPVPKAPYKITAVDVQHFHVTKQQLDNDGFDYVCSVEVRLTLDNGKELTQNFQFSIDRLPLSHKQGLANLRQFFINKFIQDTGLN